MSDTNIQECCEHGTPYIVDCKRCKDDELPASDSSVFRLRTLPRGRDLDEFIFQDENHARGWMGQEFIDDDRYEIEIGRITGRTKCCGKITGFSVQQRFKPSEFLKQNPKSQEREASSAQDSSSKE